MANPCQFFVYFRLFYMTILIYFEKSVEGVLGARTQSDRMEDADESTEQGSNLVWATF